MGVIGRIFDLIIQGNIGSNDHNARSLSKNIPPTEVKIRAEDILFVFSPFSPIIYNDDMDHDINGQIAQRVNLARHKILEVQSLTHTYGVEGLKVALSSLCNEITTDTIHSIDQDVSVQFETLQNLRNHLLTLDELTRDLSALDEADKAENSDDAFKFIFQVPQAGETIITFRQHADPLEAARYALCRLSDNLNILMNNYNIPMSEPVSNTASSMNPFTIMPDHNQWMM